MYLDRTVLDDINMVESWKGDADKILIVVGLQTTSYTSAYNVEFVDWCILCYGRGLLVLPLPNIQQSPPATPIQVFYLAHISN